MYDSLFCNVQCQFLFDSFISCNVSQIYWCQLSTLITTRTNNILCTLICKRSEILSRVYILWTLTPLSGRVWDQSCCLDIVSRVIWYLIYIVCLGREESIYSLFTLDVHLCIILDYMCAVKWNTPLSSLSLSEFLLFLFVLCRFLYFILSFFVVVNVVEILGLLSCGICCE